MKIIFIRHGDPDYDHDCLTELGHVQAVALSEHIKDLKIDKVFTSTQGRAIQTCDHCLVHHPNLKPERFDWMRELMWGDLSGDAYSTDGPWLKNDTFVKTDHAYPAGDTWKDDPRIRNDRLVGDVESRIASFDEFIKRFGMTREGQLYHISQKCDDTIVIFCHGGLTTALVSHLLNIPFWTMIAHFPMGMCGITSIDIDGEAGEYVPARIEFVNDHKFALNLTVK